MKRILLSIAFIYCYAFAFSQATGNVDLGSEITNGVMTNGCTSACQPTYCTNNPGNNTGDHSTETIAVTITGIPAAHSVEIVFTSVLCGGTSGLDADDDIFVDGVKVVDGSDNLDVNHTECVEGGADIEIEFKVNRRDEIINVSWTSGPTDPGAGCFDLSLPVTLTYFEAEKVNNNQVALNWQTESEINNEYFLVEHSINGRDFESIGKINGNGNSFKTNNYEFFHDYPVKGFNYYRLTQYDFDGTPTPTKVELVRMGFNAELRIRPSIVENEMMVEMDEAPESNVEVSIFNVTGQLVQQYTLNLETQQTIQLGHLEKGTYFMHVEHDRKVAVERFIKI